MTKRYLSALLLLIAAPALGQSSGFAAGQICTVTANTVDCVANGATGSLVITADVADFVDLRDALTANWDGNLTCTACDVVQGFPGCTAVGDVVATTRNKAGLNRLTCVLRAIVKQKRQQERQQALPEVTEPTIGGGDPGEEE